MFSRVTNRMRPVTRRTRLGACPRRVSTSVATITDEKHVPFPERSGTQRGASYPDLVQTPVKGGKLVPVAVVIFAIGLVALAAIFVLFVTGRHDLPVWLNASAGVLVPLGFALALIGLVREARRGTRRR